MTAAAALLRLEIVLLFLSLRALPRSPRSSRALDPIRRALGSLAQHAAWRKRDAAGGHANWVDFGIRRAQHGAVSALHPFGGPTPRSGESEGPDPRLEDRPSGAGAPHRGARRAALLDTQHGRRSAARVRREVGPRQSAQERSASSPREASESPVRPPARCLRPRQSAPIGPASTSPPCARAGRTGDGGARDGWQRAHPAPRDFRSPHASVAPAELPESETTSHDGLCRQFVMQPCFARRLPRLARLRGCRLAARAHGSRSVLAAPPAPDTQAARRLTLPGRPPCRPLVRRPWARAVACASAHPPRHARWRRSPI